VSSRSTLLQPGTIGHDDLGDGLAEGRDAAVDRGATGRRLKQKSGIRGRNGDKPEAVDVARYL